MVVRGKMLFKELIIMRTKQVNGNTGLQSWHRVSQ
jgi:hypothetical protein